MTDTPYTCEKCGEPKQKDEMRRYPSGGISKNCLGCGARPMATKGKKAGKVKRAKKATASPTPPSPPPAPDTPTLKMEAGYGLDARIVDGYLAITQDDNEGTVDTVMLSKSESIVLFEQFREWATP